MTLPSSRKWITLTLLAVIIPIGLLTALKLTGITPEQPTIAETIEMETATLEFDRPFKDIKAPALTSVYVDESVLINVSTSSVEYSEQGAIGNMDCLETSLWINATAFQGFVHSVEFSCSVDDVSWVTDGYYYYINMYNATVKEHNATANWIRYKFRVSNSPTAIHIPLNWIYLEGDGSVDHELSLSVSTVYYNGTAYREVIVPLIIRVVRDVGDTFEDAKPIQTGKILGSLDSVDYIDMYSVNLQRDQTINMTLIPPSGSNFNIYLYNQDHQEIANSTKGLNQTEEITYTATATQTYYIKIELVFSYPRMEGIYQLKVHVSGA